MDLSIIIVNWNSAGFVKKCLESIYANADDLEFEIVVVDNNSRDECQEIVKTYFPRVRFIQSKDNLGFAGANNLGVRCCRGRKLLFLNPDTEFVGSVMRPLSSFLDETADAGIVGPKLLNSDMSVQTSCIAPFPSILNLTLDSEFLRRIFPTLPVWGISPLLDDSTLPVPVEVVVGACLMVKAKLFETLGGFDPRYFMYAEDADLCFSANELGWKTYYVPSTHVIHHGGCSSGVQTASHFSAIVMRESILRFLRSKRGSAYANFYRGLTGWAAILRIGLLCVMLPIANKERRASRKIALRRWMRILRWALGLEEWASQLGGETKHEEDNRHGRARVGHCAVTDKR
jgi:GT2 family glycosyltransferase